MTTDKPRFEILRLAEAAVTDREKQYSSPDVNYDRVARIVQVILQDKLRPEAVLSPADMILVNKADGEFETAARHAVSDYRSAIHLLRPASPNWQVPVSACSALTGKGIEGIWSHIEDYETKLGASCEISERRAEQARIWLWSEVGDTLLERLKVHCDVRSMLEDLEERVVTGTTTPTAAGRRVLKAFLGE